MKGFQEFLAFLFAPLFALGLILKVAWVVFRAGWNEDLQ